MNMAALPRWMRWLGGGLAVAGVLASLSEGGRGAGLAAPERQDLTAAPTRPAAARNLIPAGAAGTERVELERLNAAPPSADGAMGNAFDATSWYVPPPPAPAPPPPPPMAPPLPFTYLGSYAGADAPVHILAKGDRVYTVTPGDVIDGIYLVGGMVGGSVELTYLPLGIKQMLATGGA